MFDKDIRIHGIYATHLKALARDPQNLTRPYLFNRYIDVYMNAAVIGLFCGEPIIEPDFSSKDTATIFADAVIREQSTCMYLYRLVMLLDGVSKLTPEQRIDRTFRDDANEKDTGKLTKNLKLFNSYVYAGIEYMYERIADKATNTDEMCENAYEMMKDFQEDQRSNLQDPDDYLRQNV
jgi:hypothetical protein